MSFKRGFLNRPNAFGKDGPKEQGTTTSNPTAAKEAKAPKYSPKNPQKLYEMPPNFSTIVARGPDAPPQSFRGFVDDSFKQYYQMHPDGKHKPSEIRAMGPHVLLNLDLGSNAKNGESGREKIPTWICVDQLEHMNNIVGPVPACGVEEADRVGKMWGNIQAGPDLGGPRRDGEGVLWEMREVSDKGKGLFALRDFAVGDLIISERPIQILPKIYARMREISRVDWFTHLHERRDEAQKQRFESLYNSKKTEVLGYDTYDRSKADSKPEGISRTNQLGFSLLNDESHEYLAVYGAISRVNHSCGPNTNWEYFDQTTWCLQLRACRPIKAGEELSVAYSNLLNTKAERQTYLKDLYQFVCGCPSCSLNGDELIESDIKRVELKAWCKNRTTFTAWRRHNSATRKSVIEGNENQIEVLKAEGLHTDLLDLYDILLHGYVAYSDKEKAQKYGQLVLETYEKLSPSLLEQEKIDLDDIKKMTENPEDHWLWGYGFNREKMVKVDVPVGKLSGKERPKDYERYMAWETRDYSPDGPFTQAFIRMNDRQQSEYTKASLGGVGYSIEDFGGGEFGSPGIGITFGGFGGFGVGGLPFGRFSV